jgi:hypothetical protein
MQLPLDPQDLVQVEMFTQKQGQYLGFDLEELYRQIAASARFVSMVRHDLLPVLRNRLGGGATEQQKVFRDMAVNNFGSNLKVFADLINELYVVLVDLDKQESKGRRLPLYMQMPELVDIGRTLVG